MLENQISLMNNDKEEIKDFINGLVTIAQLNDEESIVENEEYFRGQVELLNYTLDIQDLDKEFLEHVARKSVLINAAKEYEFSRKEDVDAMIISLAIVHYEPRDRVIDALITCWEEFVIS